MVSFGRQAGIWFPFSLCVFIATTYVRVHIAAGMTRRTFVRAALAVALLVAVANAVLSRRLAPHGASAGLDRVSSALSGSGALPAHTTDLIRHAIADAVDDVYLGAAAAAVLAVAILLFVTPRRFPVRPDAG